MQVSHSLEVLRSFIPKGLKKENGKFQKGGGVKDFGIWRACGRVQIFSGITQYDQEKKRDCMDKLVKVPHFHENRPLGLFQTS